MHVLFQAYYSFESPTCSLNSLRKFDETYSI